MKFVGMCVIAALILLCGCQHNVSGAYLASDSSAVLLLQLVRTPDDHLTGQLSVSTLGSDGQVKFDSVALAGVTGDGNVTLSGTRFFGLQTFTLSGTLDGSKLTLNGSGVPVPFVLKRADNREYQKELAILNGRSQTILATKAAALSRQRAEQEQRNLLAAAQQRAAQVEEAQRGFVAHIDVLIANMQRFDSEADVHLGRFHGVEEAYQAMTARVNDYVEHERRLAGNPNASVTRSQLSVAANQASLGIDQAHYQVQSLQSSFQMNLKPIADEAANVEVVCGGQNTPVAADMTTEQRQARSAACARFAGALSTFRQKYSAMTTSLAHLEQVYTHEKNTQQGLLHTAEQLR